ncbi:class I SAM-dependent methyltransferase [Micromonospora sp. 15K316]|uniref:class I SAM-dependent methyltransferase n=1 Tax=Micromonospora sp. 15K316 TaxID=2530376 RepID=UPI00104A058C|nr:class I SAM-dependent methyltransferase [Micromonospora sp. 15K316]TDC38980.1 class I SAM-dependent methyltransferase [Micromonospora sp. 15K316]
MARIAYDSEDAAAFAATRHLTGEGLSAWREAITRHIDPRPGMRLLDLGSGTGSWARNFTLWFNGVTAIAVEPAAAMRARAVHQPVLAGDATHIPLGDDTVDAAWMSTVVHHLPDLTAAAHDVRRVLRPGAPLLIRSAFAGRHQGITLFRYFPEAVRVLDTYPSVAAVETAFAAAGFHTAAFEAVPQVTAASLHEAATTLRRKAHTPLQLITDDEYDAGLGRMTAAAKITAGPVVDALDLLVLR